MLEVVIRASGLKATAEIPAQNVVPAAFGKLEIVFASVNPIPWGDLAEYARLLLMNEDVVGNGFWEVSFVKFLWRGVFVALL